MAHYGTQWFYELAYKNLTDWVWNNKKLLHKIHKHDLPYLFEFDRDRGLSINLRRFEPEYYKVTFYPPREKKKNIDEFVRKVCRVIHQTRQQVGKEDLTLTITVRHMVSEVSHWHTFYFSESWAEDKTVSMNEKEQDWYYPYRRQKIR